MDVAANRFPSLDGYRLSAIGCRELAVACVSDTHTWQEQSLANKAIDPTKQLVSIEDVSRPIATTPQCEAKWIPDWCAAFEEWVLYMQASQSTLQRTAATMQSLYKT
jgi:hypothetical protein